MLRRAGLALLVTALPALAADVVVHPLLVVGEDQVEVPELQAALASVASESLGAADFKSVRAALATEPEGLCLESDPCLARLAAATGAKVALLVTASPFSPTVVLTIRAVGAGGTVLVAERTTSFPKTPDQALPNQLRAFLRELLPAAQAEAMAKVHQDRPPEAPTQVPPSFFAQRTWRTKVGVGLGGAAVLGVAGGILLRSMAAGSFTEFDGRYPQGVPASQADEARKLHGRGSSQMLAGNLSLLGGAACLAAGAALVLLDEPKGVTP